MSTLRVLSVDARNTGRSGDALAHLVADAEADVVCVHNAPHLGRWRQRVAGLARRAGRVVVVPGGRRAGANLLLSTLGVDVLATGDARFADGGGLHPPGAALAALRREHREFVLVGATLMGNAAVRLAQVRALQTAIDRLVPGSPAVVISAIGTDRPGTAAWQSIADGRVALGGRFFVDERIDASETRELGRAAPLPNVLAVLSI